MPVFTMQRFETGPRSEDDWLVEFLAVDMKGRSFGSADIAWESLRKEKDRMGMGRPTLVFEFRSEVASAYSNWTNESIERVMVTILDGKVISAATIKSRLNGVLVGLSNARIDEIIDSIRR